RGGGWHEPGHRLWYRKSKRASYRDAKWIRQRQVCVHVAGASGGARRRSTKRRLLGSRGPLRGAHGRAAVPSGQATLRKVLTGEIPDPSALMRGVPHELDAVLRRALTRDRDHRFLTALAFQTALEAAVPPAPARDVMAAVEHVCAA